MIYLLLSNDYEVFLGGNFRDEGAVLCAPTARLLDILESTVAPMTFFCDVACLWRYRELERDDFVETVERQLCEILRRGHDVQAHIHPHWLSTDIDPRDGGGAAYRVDLSRFRIAGSATALNRSVADHAEDLGRRARDYLESLLRPIDPGYRCIAYRAGGYGIQPGSRDIFVGLKRAGYRIDSSIVPGMHLGTNVNQIDFTDLPPVANCWLEEAGPQMASPGAGLFEVPVAAGRIGTWALGATTVRRQLRRGAEAPLTGYGIQETSAASGTGRRAGKLAAVTRRILRGWDMLELSGDARHLLRITESFVRSHQGEDPLLFSLSCHSKTVDDVKLAALETYLTDLRAAHGDGLRLIVFSQIPDLLDPAARTAGAKETP